MNPGRAHASSLPVNEEFPAEVPRWPAPRRVQALATFRGGANAGASRTPYGSLNLASHVGDDVVAVAENRRRLRAQLPSEPVWLSQVHGTRVLDADVHVLDSRVASDTNAASAPRADAAVSRTTGIVLAILTADCLPVLLCDRVGSVVAVAHAGWRGLAAGVIENTVRALAVDPGRLIAWFGAAIGPGAFEVGPEVRETFLSADTACAGCFAVAENGRYRADLYALARRRLNRAGVHDIFGGGQCTVSDATRYFSYRRDGLTGRMATLIWIAP